MNWDHWLAGFEFLAAGSLIALTTILGTHLWRIRRQLPPMGWRYMSRITLFLWLLSIWWFGSRLVLLGFDDVDHRLNIGRTCFVLLQLWAEWGLLQFLGSREKGQDMFDFGLGYKDFTRIVWTFVQGVLGYAAAVWANVVPGEAFNWKAFAVGAFAAGWSAIKNFALADSSSVK